MNRNLSWKPVRNGETYCSPACGHGCTHEAFKRATTNAEKLCRLLGAGWQPRVHENMGWHFSAYSVYGSGQITADCYFFFHPIVDDDAPNKISGWADMSVMGRQFHSETGMDPKHAVEVVLGMVRAFRDELNAAIEKFS